LSVPVSPATASELVTIVRRLELFQKTRSKLDSARAVTRSSRDSPEPSTIRAPESGTPAAARSRRTIEAPVAVEPMPAPSAPIAFSTISAVKLSLSAFISRSSTDNLCERMLASSVVFARARPTTASRASIPCARSIWSKSAAAARAGSRASWGPRHARLTTSAESGADSSP
jgi:hypothetical protein